MRRCIANSCTNEEIFAKNLCYEHFKEISRNRPFNFKESKKYTTECSIEECGQPYRSKGFCRNHYLRFNYYKKNYPHLSEQEIIKIINSNKLEKYKKRVRRYGEDGSKNARCAVENCDKLHKANGFCDRHDGRFQYYRKKFPKWTIEDAVNFFNVNDIKKKVNKTSEFKGVHFSEYHQKWRSTLTHKKKTYRLGYFDSEEKAAEAYKKAKAMVLEGETRLDVIKEEIK